MDTTVLRACAWDLEHILWQCLYKIELLQQECEMWKPLHLCSPRGCCRLELLTLHDQKLLQSRLWEVSTTLSWISSQLWKVVKVVIFVLIRPGKMHTWHIPVNGESIEANRYIVMCFAQEDDFSTPLIMSNRRELGTVWGTHCNNTKDIGEEEEGCGETELMLKEKEIVNYNVLCEYPKHNKQIKSF